MTSAIKRCLGMFAAAAYLLPLSASVLTNVVHDAYHLREYLEHGTTEVAEFHEPQPGDFVHAHGGAEHSHGAATDALLGAADRTDEPADEHHAPALELVGHLPATGMLVALLGPEGGVEVAESTSPLQTSRTPPPLPPPRA